MNGSRVKDLVSGCCFLALGMFVASQAVGFKIWGGIGPKEGFFPFIVGLLIVASSLVVIGKAVLPALRYRPKGEEQGAEEEKSPGSLSKVISYSALLICYAGLLRPVGFLITTPIFLLLLLGLVERQRWKITIAMTIILTAASYILFVYLLMVPLPKGLLR